MLSADVFVRIDAEQTEEHTLMVPPATIVDTTAETLLSAICNRLGDLQAREDERNTHMLLSDSARSMLRLHKHFVWIASHSGGSVLALHARCMMHMFWAALCAAFGVLKQINKIFCATVLLHKGPSYRKLVQGVEQFVSKLTIEYVSEREEPCEYNKMLVRMLDDAESLSLSERDAGEEEGDQEADRSARFYLKRWFCYRQCFE